MTGMMKMSEAASLALHALGYLARSEKSISTKEIAQTLSVSEAHLAKVMQRLERSGLVAGKRGPAGGFTLLRTPERITLREIYEAIEGRLESHACMLGKAICNRQCPLGNMLHSLEREINENLSKIKLSEFALKSGIRILKEA